MLTTSISNLSAADYCSLGQFEEAAGVLAGWRGIGLRPARRGEADLEYAEQLQWAAVISVELSITRQVPIGDSARDMLTESFGLSGKTEPLVWLGICYHRTGEYNESEAMLRSCLDREMEPRVRFLALRNLAVVRTYQGDRDEALRILDNAESLMSFAPLLGKGRLHLQRGLIFRQLDRLDDAISEYSKADQCFEDAHSQSLEAAVAVNKARVFVAQGRYLQAHVSAQRAVSLFTTLKDRLNCAKAWDEIARIYMAEGKLENAERAARQAVALVEGGEQEQVKAECLITHGIILGKMGVAHATESLNRAADICARIGDHAQQRVATQELVRTLRDYKTLIASITETIRPVEHRLIKDALARNRGVVSRAAAELDMPTNTLIKKVKKQFPDLLNERRPIYKRPSRRTAPGVNSGN